jgi:hypothetical protein
MSIVQNNGKSQYIIPFIVKKYEELNYSRFGDTLFIKLGYWFCIFEV